jgi:phage terminase large subunit-like protein
VGQIEIVPGTVSCQGRVHPGQQELWDEIVTFPCGGHDDLADAAAMGVGYLMERVEPRVW